MRCVKWTEGCSFHRVDRVCPFEKETFEQDFRALAMHSWYTGVPKRDQKAQSPQDGECLEFLRNH